MKGRRIGGLRGLWERERVVGHDEWKGEISTSWHL